MKIVFRNVIIGQLLCWILTCFACYYLKVATVYLPVIPLIIAAAVITAQPLCDVVKHKEGIKNILLTLGLTAFVMCLIDGPTVYWMFFM